MIFLDSSVVVHAAGNIGYAWAVAVLRGAGCGGRRYVTDSICLQEIAETMGDILRPEQARLCLQAAQSLVFEVLPVDERDLRAAGALAAEAPGASPRVRLHAAVMRRHGLDAFCAVRESGYLLVPGLHPAETASLNITLE